MNSFLFVYVTGIHALFVQAYFERWHGMLMPPTRTIAVVDFVLRMTMGWLACSAWRELRQDRKRKRAKAGTAPGTKEGMRNG